MSAPDFVNRANAEFIDRLYEQYRRAPESLEPTWRAFFAGVETGRAEATVLGADGLPATSDRPKTYGLVAAYRDLGHLLAHIDPLSEPLGAHPLLTIDRFNFKESDLERAVDPGGFRGEPPPTTLGELVQALRETYCRTLGVEYTGIRDPEQREWLETRMEASRNVPDLDRSTRMLIYTKLVEAEAFEQFLHVKYPGQKRFSLEGGETLIPMLEMLIEECAKMSVEQLVLGMAHRGRLNVLANIVRKPYEMIFSEFEGSTLPDWVQGDGDVKYHQGYSRDHHASNGRTVHVSLTPNPSHLEAVNPVVEGKVRAKQQLLGDRNHEKVVPVLVHGDASFVGQGIVAETLLLSHLPGYYTGGTVHIVVNNQIGFTTPPSSGRPTRYATDIARIIESPVFHVNGDDPEAAVQAVRLALGFRQRFGKDVVIDLVCYRKYGHNELDEPTFTQPTMYKKIAAHPGTPKIYASRLVEQHGFRPEELDGVRKEVNEILDLALSYARDFRPRQEVFSFGDAWSGLGPAGEDRTAHTAVPRERLEQIAERAARIPEGFHAHPKVKKQYEQRLEMVRRGKGIDWGCAEMLAYGSLLLEGTAVRLSGQDSGRGTFSHRHAVLHDQETGEEWVPLNAIAREGETQATFEVIDSMLSEAAVLGFEYGYSSAAPRILTLWEAQFGDFANGAQVIIDTFIAAGESKWQRANGLVMLLPHGYEGQGPEHSSARLERFLQLCGDDNMQVVNATTAAQFFHLLRRQMLRPFRKPLIVMSPKSLLRAQAASSAIEDFTEGTFQPVLPDPVSLDPDGVTTIAFCSGKVFYDLAKAREDRADLRVAAIRIEELYPFPAQRIAEVLEAYPNARDVVWLQEEPMNMGAWWYITQHLPPLLGDRSLRYAGRDEAASPATGSYRLHGKEQAALLAAVFDGIPERPATRPRRIANAAKAQAAARSR
ncbi:MAG TPA: 2-oxoglutarate dehydrogenase E1 component [Candidatus Binatia bacterium]